jgi:hypothetical protein
MLGKNMIHIGKKTGMTELFQSDTVSTLGERTNVLYYCDTFFGGMYHTTTTHMILNPNVDTVSD